MASGGSGITASSRRRTRARKRIRGVRGSFSHTYQARRRLISDGEVTAEQIEGSGAGVQGCGLGFALRWEKDAGEAEVRLNRP